MVGYWNKVIAKTAIVLAMFSIWLVADLSHSADLSSSVQKPLFMGPRGASGYQVDYLNRSGLALPTTIQFAKSLCSVRTDS